MGVYKRVRTRADGKTSTTWWISYSTGGARFREPGGRTKVEAETLLAKRRVEAHEGRHFPDKRKAELTFEAMRAMWMDRSEHKRSLEADRQRLGVIVEHFGARALIASITGADIEGFKRVLLRRETVRGRPMAPATVNRHITLLRSCLRLAKQRGYHHRDPMAGVKLLPEDNERDRICSPAEYAALLERAAPDLRLAVVLGYWTGMRCGEIAHLRWEQVERGPPPAVRLRGRETKTGEGRVVPLAPQAWDALRAYPRRIDGQIVGMRSDVLSTKFARLCRQAEIGGLRFHDLRHTAATNLRRAGVDLLTIQRITGHKSLAMLKRYNTVDLADLGAAVAAVDRLHQASGSAPAAGESSAG